MWPDLKTILATPSAKTVNPLREGYHLGSVGTGRRSVTKVPSGLLALVPKPTGGNETILKSNADPVKHTVPLIIKLVNRQLWQGKKLAAKLKGNTIAETVRNDWQFMFDHIQYVPDQPGSEQVKSLRRLIHDGKGDCDDFACALQNLLINQGITNAKFRIAGYDGSANFSHIYLIVPNGSGYITLDPVVHQFNYEVPFTSKKDFDMKLQSLDGLGVCIPTANSSANSNSSVAQKIVYVIPSSQIKQEGFENTETFLQAKEIPYTKITGTAGNGDTYQVGTRVMPSFVPLVNQEQLAASLKQELAAQSIAQTQPTIVDQNKAKIAQAGGWVLGVVGLLLLLGSSNTKKNVPGVGLGVPGKKKLAFINI